MPIFAYHMVDPRFSTALTRVTPRQLEQQIQFVLEHDFDIVTISEYLRLSRTDKAIAITFDDGYESVFNYAFPLLKKYDVPATLFINPSFVGQFNTWDVNLGQRFRHMDWQQVYELKEAGWEIGSHGMTHRDLSRLSQETAEKELAQSQNMIKRKVGACSTVISYPFGNLSVEVVDAAKRLDFKFGLAMGMFNKNMPLHYSIQRTGVYRLDTLFIFKLKAFARFTFFFRLIQIILDKCSDATVVSKQKKWAYY